MLLEPWYTVFLGYPEKVINAAVILTPRERIQLQVVRIPSVVSHIFARKPMFPGRIAIVGFQPEVNANVDLMIDRRSV